MLLATLASHKKTIQTMDRGFMIGVIKGHPGINIMSERPRELMFQYPNELHPFVFAAMFVGDQQGMNAVAGPPYDGFSVTISLKGDGGFLVSKGGRGRSVSPRGKWLADYFIGQGASLVP